MKLNVIAVIVLSIVLAGCAAPGGFTDLNRTISEQAGQTTQLMTIYQDESYQQVDGSIKAPAVVQDVVVEEREVKGKAASNAGALFGVIGSAVGGVIDNARDGEIVKTYKYVVRTEKDVQVTVTQPKDSDFIQSFEKGEQVVIRTTKPVTEGGATVFLDRS